MTQIISFRYLQKIRWHKIDVRLMRLYQVLSRPELWIHSRNTGLSDTLCVLHLCEDSSMQCHDASLRVTWLIRAFHGLSCAQSFAKVKSRPLPPHLVPYPASHVHPDFASGGARICEANFLESGTPVKHAVPGYLYIWIWIYKYEYMHMCMHILVCVYMYILLVSPAHRTGVCRMPLSAKHWRCTGMMSARALSWWTPRPVVPTPVMMTTITLISFHVAFFCCC